MRYMVKTSKCQRCINRPLCEEKIQKVCEFHSFLHHENELREELESLNLNENDLEMMLSETEKIFNEIWSDEK